jgi:hypothetical protein
MGIRGLTTELDKINTVPSQGKRRMTLYSVQIETIITIIYALITKTILKWKLSRIRIIIFSPMIVTETDWFFSYVVSLSDLQQLATQSKRTKILIDAYSVLFSLITKPSLLPLLTPLVAMRTEIIRKCLFAWSVFQRVSQC